MHSDKQVLNSTQPNQKTRSRQFNESSILQQTTKKMQGYVGIIGTGKTCQKIRMTMWNVNGIRSVLNKNAMRDFIQRYNPDFICINQTKINAQLYTKEKIKIKGYHDYWNFCKCSAGYSGVAIFSKYLPKSIFEDLQQVEYSQEGRVLTLQYQKFYLVVVYMPSAGNSQLKRLQYKTQRYEVAFQRYCEQLKTKGKGVIVCGDMNVSHQQIDLHVTPYTYKQPGFTPEQRISFKKFLNKGWVDTFRKLNPTLRKYTWWRLQHKNREKNVGRRLDYFLVNQQFFPVVKKSEVLDQVMGSDHCPIILEINLAQIHLNSQKMIHPQQEKQNINLPSMVAAVEKTELIENSTSLLSPTDKEEHSNRSQDRQDSCLGKNEKKEIEQTPTTEDTIQK